MRGALPHDWVILWNARSSDISFRATQENQPDQGHAQMDCWCASGGQRSLLKHQAITRLHTQAQKKK